MINEIKAIINKDLPLVSNLSNITSILKDMDNINWCGYYIADGSTLFLGPFQGDLACTVIPFGRGVCGTSALNKETLVVPDVTKFPGHIACSALSRSEIVVPIILDNEVKAVIDIDAPIVNRFTEEDKKELEEIANLIAPLFVKKVL